MKYLFTATFSDGHVVAQTHEDTSTLIPPDEQGNGPSAFYDVLNRSDLETFVLASPTEANKVIVNLKTGDIVVDGVLQPINQIVPPDTKKEIVYWRMMSMSNQSTVPQCSGFIAGWKAIIDDKEFQHVAMVS
jgi:hypothetical protein